MLIILLFVQATVAWDYLLFSQVNPNSWDPGLNATDYFSIHGLWPSNFKFAPPEYCNRSIVFNITDLTLIIDNLTVYWSDYSSNVTKFWEHEYYKHYSCAKTLSSLKTEYDYFSTGLKLRKKYDVYQLLQQGNITRGGNYTFGQIQTALQPFNATVFCENKGYASQLSEVRIPLSKEFIVLDFVTLNTNCDWIISY